MSFDKLRKVVVIKNIPSNYIEEAIFILRADENAEAGLLKKKSLISEKTMKDGDYLIKEAQNIINNYIKECEEKAGKLNTASYINNARDLKGNKKVRAKEKVRKIRKKVSLSSIIYVTLLGSLIAFIYLLIQIATY